jgi:hypothetical protein
VYGGGAIHVEFPKHAFTSAKLENINELAAFCLDANVNSSAQIRINMIGGNPKLHTITPASFFNEVRGLSKFNLWKESLLNYPTVLTHTPAVLKGLTSILRAAGEKQSIVEEVGKAIVYFQSGEADEADKLIGLYDSCTSELSTAANGLGECEAQSGTRLKQINEQKLNNEKCTKEKVTQLQELISIKSRSSKKDLEILGLKSQVDSLKGSLRDLESNLVRVKVLYEQALVGELLGLCSVDVEDLKKEAMKVALFPYGMILHAKYII